jgi:integrase
METAGPVLSRAGTLARTMTRSPCDRPQSADRARPRPHQARGREGARARGREGARARGREGARARGREGARARAGMSSGPICKRQTNIPGRGRVLVRLALKPKPGEPAPKCRDLLPSYGIRPLQQGMDIYALARHLGHSSIKTTERYIAWIRTEPAQNRHNPNLIGGAEDPRSLYGAIG